MNFIANVKMRIVKSETGCFKSDLSDTRNVNENLSGKAPERRLLDMLT